LLLCQTCTFLPFLTAFAVLATGNHCVLDLVGGALIALAASFAMPLATLVSVSFHEMTGPAQVADDVSLINYSTFLTDVFFLRILLNTVWMGLLVVAFCLLLGYPIAYFLARTQSRWRGVFLFLTISPLLISAVIRNVGWFPILSKVGLLAWLMRQVGYTGEPVSLLGGQTGVVIGLVHALLPFMILTLMTVIQRIEVELEEASANLGAGPVESFLRVLLPLSIPGVVAGSLLVFTMAISAYTTPVIMGGGRVLVMATYIAQQFRTVLDYGMGGAAAAILMVLVGALTLLALRFSRSGAHS
jgi:putative spermidine/putrescine transport system permease protein